ncbi:hypothetical protein M8C21_000750 [Ambrosia artemisiifolia]|uniref:Membralin n=1 Tax=Ambrosia artemisiifolia TaxID=4212 RepID=A0AAD5CKG4_AMBAR|nr:hypothetical protein M8C21_000750 [Ambrosia artemisiifolia]
MDPEQTFIRVQERFSHVLTPRIRASLEYIYLIIAISLFCVLVVMHANYVQQPGCSSELTGVATTEAQLIQIKITSAGLWSQSEAPQHTKNNEIDKESVANDEKDDAQIWSNWLISSSGWSGKSALRKLWRSDNEVLEPQPQICTSSSDNIEDAYGKKTKKDESRGRWQQLLINRLVGYDTILMNSLLNSPGQGYLFNYQTSEFYNLTYAHEKPERSANFGDYFATKCGVLMMSLFVFFTTTMSVSFTLRETQTRMLKFTVQLQHHARHRLPTFQLIFVHVIESLVFVPIMIGILFFLFEFYDDQLLAFMVLILVWLCELFTLISVRTPISMKFFPRFFLLYFLVFHIYFFSYTHGFSYLALSTTSAFMLHLILYFWNHFEVPALQRFMQNRRSQFQQQPDFHITSSTILASTLHITRLNPLRNAINNATNPGPTQPQAENDNMNMNRVSDNEGGGAMNSFSSTLLWILGGASSEGLNSFFSMFRDQGQENQAIQ